MSGREPLDTLRFRPSPFYSLNRNRQTFAFWTPDRGPLPSWPSRFQWSDGDALSSVASLSTPLSPWRSRIPSFRTCRLIAAEPGASPAPARPPKATAQGALIRLVRIPTCMPPRGRMFQVVPKNPITRPRRRSGTRNWNSMARSGYRSTFGNLAALAGDGKFLGSVFGLS